MDGCIFAIGYILWIAIKGIFKLIQLPFKLIISRIEERKREKENEIKKREKENKDERDRQNVDTLFQKIAPYIFYRENTPSLPERILVYSFGIELFYGDKSTYIKYKDHGLQELEGYYTWWCTDGKKSEYKVNQVDLLATKINERANFIYFCKPKTLEQVRDTIDGDVLHTTTLEYVELKKK